MTIARRLQISLDHTSCYHCISRCVRRAFLCGEDRYSGKNFDHRRVWLERRLAKLSNIFAIELLAYAIMSNHYHVVVRVNSNVAGTWSEDEVMQRWRRVFYVPEAQTVDKSPIEEWRDRLRSISWFMRCLNEPLARLANKEDACSGRFWEGRFKCQALLDDSAVLRCMTYVDLNPVRAGTAATPEESAHTSVRARLFGNDQHLAPFTRPNSVMSISKDEYLQLVDWSGRIVRDGKRGCIDGSVPSILERQSLDIVQWHFDMRHYGRWYYRAVGSTLAVKQYCQHLGQRWLHHADITLRGVPTS